MLRLYAMQFVIPYMTRYSLSGYFPKMLGADFLEDGSESHWAFLAIGHIKDYMRTHSM